MTELANSLQTFAQNVRIVDFLDVATFSVILYLLLTWFRESASKRTITSILILLGMYILARLTEMYLTEIFIEGLFIFILIGLVVVFQSDIRRLIDHIGRWRFGNNELTGHEGHVISDTIAEAVSQMADNRTGALIVIKGTEDLERHINGGVELDGSVSLPLLRSIFNPTAPGHDGAILIENQKITKFGVHLPLSTHLNKISEGGTRHAAALGLSEHCDALIVVVSEERGVISVARSGELQKLESASELKERLLAFEEEYVTFQTANLKQRWQRVNWQTATASITLSVLLWFAIAYNADTIYRTYEVPIEYRNLNSSNIAIQDSVPIQARITLSGPEQAFQLLDPSQLVVSFNLASNSLPSDSLVITNEQINIPSDLDLYDVSPKSLKVTKLQRRKVPVKIPTEGELSSRFKLDSVTADPSEIALDFQSGKIPDSIAVKPIDLASVSGSTTYTWTLTVPPNATLPSGVSNKIKIQISVSGQDE